MIKLSIHANAQKDVKIFDKPVVIIGSNVSETCDVALPGEVLSPLHIKIFEHRGTFTIVNQANDPFVTLNGRPFGKKNLQNDDRIQIGNTVITFEGEISLPIADSQVISAGKMIPTDKLTDIVEEVITHHRLDSNAEALEEEEKKEAEILLADHNWEMDKMSEKEIHDLLMQVEELETGQDTLIETSIASSDTEELSVSIPTETNIVFPVTSQESNKPNSDFSPIRNKGSLKDSYLSELDDDQPQKTSIRKETFIQEKWNLKSLGWGFLAFLLLAGIIGSFFYVKLATKHNKEELKAAESVADVAMALAFAQVHHIKPQNQNWADPDFLKNNLTAVLPTENTPLVELDHHGQFNNIAYLLRIYTSHDLSQFLIIAQPEPSLLQWFAPKSSIIVHSKTMELKKIDDLKLLNRLLINPKTLDDTSASELSYLIKQAELIPLDKLSRSKNSADFTPPTALAHIRPGAENLIYNAPRYYLFGETFLKKAQMLANETENNDYESFILQEALEELLKYPSLVLYTTHGIQWAQEAQRQLNLFSHQNKILVANLKLNPKGEVTNSQLLMGEGPSDVAITELEDKAERQNFSNNDTLEEPGSLSQQIADLRADYKNSLHSVDTQIRELLEESHLDHTLSLVNRLKNLLQRSEKNLHDNPEKLKKNQSALAFIEKLQALLVYYQAIKFEEQEYLMDQLPRLYLNTPSTSGPQFLSQLESIL